MVGYAEYTKLRDIARKRSQRLSNKGLAPEINFPTVKELKAQNISVEQAIANINRFVNAPTTVRKFSTLTPTEKVTTILTTKNTLQNERRKAKHREASKRYREKLRNLTKQERGYLKAAHTLGMKKVKDIQAFGEYIEMRFAQSADQSPYAISDYIDQYKELENKPGYNPKQIEEDYNKFLLDREALIESGAYMNGVDYLDSDRLFKDFVSMILGE